MRVNREEFLKQLESVMPGLSTKTSVEQTPCFIFKDKTVNTFNGEIACSQKSQLSVEGVVPAIPSISILRKIKEKELEISINDKGSQLLVKTKSERVGINMEQDIVLAIETIEAIDKPGDWKNLPDNFADAIAIVQPCVGNNDALFVLTCIHITPKWVEACDMHHAARFRIKTGINKPILIRKESLKHIVSLDMIEFSETKHWIHFRSSDGLIFSCRYEIDDYPSDDITQVLKMEGNPLILPKGLKETVEKAEVFSSENIEGGSIVVNIKKGKFKIAGIGTFGFYTKTKKSKYAGESLQFTIPPKLLVRLVQDYNECEISENRLKVKGGKFTYVTVLGKVDGKST